MHHGRRHPTAQHLQLCVCERDTASARARQLSAHHRRDTWATVRVSEPRSARALRLSAHYPQWHQKIPSIYFVYLFVFFVRKSFHNANDSIRCVPKLSRNCPTWEYMPTSHHLTTRLTRGRPDLATVNAALYCKIPNKQNKRKQKSSCVLSSSINITHIYTTR